MGNRYQHQIKLLKERPLSHPREGAGRGVWSDSEKMRGTVGTALDIRLAVEDFKTILQEIKAELK